MRRGFGSKVPLLAALVVFALAGLGCSGEKPAGKAVEAAAPVEPAEPGSVGDAPEDDAPAPSRSALADKILACPEKTELVRVESERWCEKVDPSTGEKVKHGPYYKFHDEDTLAEQGEFALGRRHGKFVTYYEDGQKKAEASFVEGVQDGPYRAWRKDGTVEADAVFRGGKPVR